jgi:hypothetical protein
MSLGKHLALASLAFALSTQAGASSVAVPAVELCRGESSITLSSPSKFEFLVLASIADAPHLLAFGAYWSPGDPRDAAEPADTLGAADDVPLPHRTNN